MLAGRHLNMAPVLVDKVASRAKFNEQFPVRIEASDDMAAEIGRPVSRKEKTR